MSASRIRTSSDDLNSIDDELFAEVGSVKRGAFEIDELAQYCFKCKEHVAEGVWCEIGFGHLDCVQSISPQEVKAYYSSLSQSKKSSDKKKIDLKAGKHFKFDGKKVEGKRGSNQIYAIRKGIYIDDHQAKHFPTWPGSAHKGGTLFPRATTKNDFVRLWNQVIDSDSLQKVLSNPPSKHSSVKDVIVQLNSPLKYGKREGIMKNKTLHHVRVQISYESDWYMHMYPVEVS